MPVDTTDLGAAVCRAVMRTLDDKPVALELHRPGFMPRYEATSAGERTVLRQWCAILMPTPDFVTVRAQFKRWDSVLYDLAILNPDGEPFERPYLYIRYPDAPAQIAGAQYETKLYEAVRMAVEAVERDRARAYAEHAAKTAARGE